MTKIATDLEQLHVYHRDATSELVVTLPLRPDGPSDWDEGQADGIWRDLYNDAADQAGVSSRANGSGDETQIAVTLPDSETLGAGRVPPVGRVSCSGTSRAVHRPNGSPRRRPRPARSEGPVVDGDTCIGYRYRLAIWNGSRPGLPSWSGSAPRPVPCQVRGCVRRCDRGRDRQARPLRLAGHLVSAPPRPRGIRRSDLRDGGGGRAPAAVLSDHPPGTANIGRLHRCTARVGRRGPRIVSAAGGDPVGPGTIVKEWGRIGVLGFGGPPAHITMLRRLCVEKEGWLTPHDFEDGIAATNLLPGPASTQLAIFCAWRISGIPGALLGGLAFIYP